MLRTMQRKSGTTVRHLATFGARYSCLGRLANQGSDNYYEVLNVPRNSSGKDIKCAFIKLSKKFHPDASRNMRDSDEFVKICEAYKTLAKTASRSRYDSKLRAKMAMITPMDSSYTNRDVRSAWEKYQAAMRYKQFGYDVKRSISSSIPHKRPQQLNAICLGLKVPFARTEPEPAESNEWHVGYPSWGRDSGKGWQYMCYLTGFGIIGGLVCLSMIDKLQRRRIKNSQIS